MIVDTGPNTSCSCTRARALRRRAPASSTGATKKPLPLATPTGSATLPSPPKTAVGLFAQPRDAGAHVVELLLRRHRPHAHVFARRIADLDRAPAARRDLRARPRASPRARARAGWRCTSVPPSASCRATRRRRTASSPPSRASRSGPSTAAFKLSASTLTRTDCATTFFCARSVCAVSDEPVNASTSCPLEVREQVADAAGDERERAVGQELRSRRRAPSCGAPPAPSTSPAW